MRLAGALLALCLGSAVARAEPPTSIALERLLDSRVRVETAGAVYQGKLIHFENSAVTLVVEDEKVVTIPRDQIAAVILAEPPRHVAISGGETPEPVRHVGVFMGIPPGLLVDVEYRRFYAFASTIPLFPMVFSGDLAAVAAGVGLTSNMSPRWRFDLYLEAAPMRFKTGGPTSYLGIGAGVDFRYTAPSGWTLAIRLPVFGIAAELDSRTGYSPGVGLDVLVFYLAAFTSVPVFTWGHRF